VARLDYTITPDATDSKENAMTISGAEKIVEQV
jgi:hypothetical protein